MSLTRDHRLAISAEWKEAAFHKAPHKLPKEFSHFRERAKQQQSLARVARHIPALLDALEEAEKMARYGAVWLKEMSSADGSGHADLGRRIDEMLADIREQFPADGRERNEEPA